MFLALKYYDIKTRKAAQRLAMFLFCLAMSVHGPMRQKMCDIKKKNPSGTVTCQINLCCVQQSLANCWPDYISCEQEFTYTK